MCVVFPHSILSVIRKSDDYKAICLAVSPNVCSRKTDLNLKDTL